MGSSYENVALTKIILCTVSQDLFKTPDAWTTPYIKRITSGSAQSDHSIFNLVSVKAKR